MVEVDLLDFVGNCKRPAKQASGRHAGEPKFGGRARWQHVAAHCFRIEEGYSYRETENRLEYMSDIHDALGFDREGVPDYSTIEGVIELFSLESASFRRYSSTGQSPRTGRERGAIQHASLGPDSTARGGSGPYEIRRIRRTSAW